VSGQRYRERPTQQQATASSSIQAETDRHAAELAAEEAKEAEQAEEDHARRHARYDELQVARRESQRVLKKLKDHKAWEVDWRRYLLPAAQHVLSVLTELSDDEEFWRGLALAEAALADSDAEERWAVYEELLDLDLTDLLDLLDYRPPPPSYEIAIDLQVALQRATTGGWSSISHDLTDAARTQMALFTYHLRPLVENAESVEAESTDEKGFSVELAAAVKKGAQVLVPSALAAVATGALFPPAAPGGMAAAATIGLIEGGRELTKQAVATGSAVLLADAFGDQGRTADPGVIFEAAGESFERSVGEVFAIARYMDEHRSVSQRSLDYVRGASLEAVRRFHRLERARHDLVPGPGVLESGMAAQAALTAIRAFRDWLVEGYESVDSRTEWSTALNEITEYRRVLDEARERLKETL
jgi:hypothetical protein